MGTLKIFLSPNPRAPNYSALSRALLLRSGFEGPRNEGSQHFLIPFDAIHLWCCALEETIAPHLQDRYLELLSPDEIARMKGFRFEKHRSQFLIAHAFLRTVLSRYQGCSPASIGYSLNEYGKPFLRLDTGQSAISFNLSHTDGLACCAIAKDGEIGVDVECTENLAKGDEIAEQFFSSAEFADMMAIEEEDARKERFCHLWILKEAFIKAKGMGLSLPLDLFGFKFREGEQIAVSFAPKLEESAEFWIFRLLEPTTRHRAAIAYKAPPAKISKSYSISLYCLSSL